MTGLFLFKNKYKINMSYNCEILADSENEFGDRITTMKIRFPRFILAEFNTHRMFSRNSASSRAIPFKKMVKMVEDNPFIPIAWQKDHKGMQGTEYFTSNKEFDKYPQWEANALLNSQWKLARNAAISNAKTLSKLGVTKQLCNRLLEPFMWHEVIVTATEWGNFFKLRCPQYRLKGTFGVSHFNSKKDAIRYHSEINENKEINEYTDLDWLSINQSQAEIHIQAISELMWDAYNESAPKQLKAGEWHIPFGDNFDEIKVAQLDVKLNPDDSGNAKMFNFTDLKIKIAVVRCARISYQTLGDNPKIDYEADIKLHDILVSNGHASPLEHCAKAMTNEEYNLGYTYKIGNYEELGWCRNFRGFRQYREILGI